MRGLRARPPHHPRVAASVHTGRRDQRHSQGVSNTRRHGRVARARLGALRSNSLGAMHPTGRPPTTPVGGPVMSSPAPLTRNPGGPLPSLRPPPQARPARRDRPHKSLRGHGPPPPVPTGVRRPAFPLDHPYPPGHAVVENCNRRGTHCPYSRVTDHLPPRSGHTPEPPTPRAPGWAVLSVSLQQARASVALRWAQVAVWEDSPCRSASGWARPR
jgi:hypothetical protein